MIHDAQDGTSGRHVWRIALPGKDVYVIANDAHAARAWLRSVVDSTEMPPGPLVVTDYGSADRTEIGVWHDERYLTNPPTATQPGRGA